MATRILQGPNIEHVDLRVIAVEGDYNQYNLSLEGRSLSELLQPIIDASHTRDRKRSPPDSACLPGTRRVVVKWIVSWVSSSVLIKRQHILWVYGYAGCGKSAIAQEISEQVQGGGRLLATFFFYRNEGDRSKIGRLPNTLASQMATSLPETAPFIEAAVKAEPELLQVQSRFSLCARLQRLLYEPVKAVAGQTSLAQTFLSDPYLIVIDGLDECDDKEGVQEFITTTLRFFDQNPSIPLRFLITSRVEQHIHSHLTTNGGVRSKDLADHCSRDDIENFMGVVFSTETKGNPVIQAHIRQNGPWPSRADSQKLVDHTGGSFIFGSTLFKFIFEKPASEHDRSLPLARFPLALNIDPGLDGLYSQTLARSEHLPYFTEIISTVALLAKPLPISGIAELLDIQGSAVANVFVDLQAIIRVPGTDEAPVTFYHTSLRDFLTTESRSGRFFTPPSFHAHLAIHCLSCELRALRQSRKDRLDPRKQTAAVRYSLEHREIAHWNRGSPIFSSGELSDFMQSRRDMAEVGPADDRAAGFDHLGSELCSLFTQDGLISTIEQAISMHRKALSLRPHPHPDRPASLNNLGLALQSLFDHNRCVSHVEEAISLHHEALSLCPHPHPDRPTSLNNFGIALRRFFEHNQCVSHVEEAISMHREDLSLCPHPHPDRSVCLINLGFALQSLAKHNKCVSHIEEALPMLREALGLCPHPHQFRHYTLHRFGVALHLLFGHNRCISHLEEAIPMLREALSLRSHIHLYRYSSLNDLSAALYDRFDELGSVGDLDEAISLRRESLETPHYSRPDTLSALARYLQTRYNRNQSIGDLEDAISFSRDLVAEYYPEGHDDRDRMLGELRSLLQLRFEATGNQDDLDEIERLEGEGEK